MVPSTSVYLVWPARIASIAASLTKSGVSKSGSPALRPMTSTPSAFSAVTRAVIASVADGWMRLRAAERCGFSDMEEAFRGCGWTGNCARRAYRVRAPFARRAADNLPMHADKHRNPEPVEEGLSTRNENGRASCMERECKYG